MKGTLESLGEIDWVQNVVYFFIFVLIVAILFFVFVQPAILLFKQDNIAYRKSVFRYEQVTQALQQKTEQLQKFQHENRTMLDSFRRRFDHDTFASFSDRYFQTFNVTGVARKSNTVQGFLVDEVNVSTVLKSPSDLYDYIRLLNAKMGYIAQVSFPIEFQATEQGIQGNFMIKIYNTEDGDL
jgi:hypothetical protein